MKTILITGCSSGIGKALAEAFLANGDTVIATARNAESLASLQAAGCTTLALEVTSAESRAAAFASISATFGQLDMLINNAGISRMGPLADMPIDMLREQLETNSVAPIAMVQDFLPLLQTSNANGGRPLIINIGSVSGLFITPFAGAYCASKAALHALNDSLRMELKPLGIEVMNVQPGMIKSSLGDNGSAAIDTWLNEKSRYWQLKDKIYGRATMQQNGATHMNDFAAELVAAAQQPKPVVRIGNNSRKMPFLARWLPTKRLDAMLAKKFGLNNL